MIFPSPSNAGKSLLKVHETPQDQPHIRKKRAGPKDAEPFEEGKEGMYHSQSEFLVPAWVEGVRLHGGGANDLGGDGVAQGVPMLQPLALGLRRSPLEAEPETGSERWKETVAGSELQGGVKRWRWVCSVCVCVYM